VTVLTVDGDRPDQSGEFALWVAAAVIILVLHVALAVAYLRLRPEPEARAEAPAFDVAFMPSQSAPAAPPAVDQPDPAPTKMDQPEDPPKELPPPLVPDEPPPPQPPHVEAMVPPEPPPPAPLVAVEPVPPVPVPEATVVPPEKPVEAAPPPPKPAVVREPPPRTVTHDEKVEKRQAPPKSVAAPGSNKPMRVATAPNPGAESQGARLGLESWLSQFAAQIRRAASYPTGATGSGTAQVSVTVARNGRVVSRRLTGSAGSPTLDQAALAAIDRAQPFPPFPASMPEAQISRTVPLHLRPQ
jgi:protein TonB